MADNYFGLVLALFGLVGMYYMITYFAHVTPSSSKGRNIKSINPSTILSEYRNSKDKKATMDKYKGASIDFPCKFHSVKEAEEGLLEVVFLFGPELVSCSVPTKKYPFLLKSNSTSALMFYGTIQKISNESIRMEEKSIIAL